MIIELPIAQTIDNVLYTHVEIKKPRGNVLANTEEIIKNKNEWYAILEFLKGCIVQLQNENNNTIPNDIIIKSLYWNNIKVILIKIMALINNDSYVKGIYHCDMCGGGVVVKKENDNSVKYIDLKIIKGEDKYFNIELEESLDIKDKNTQEIILSVSSLTFRLATLNDLISVSNKGKKATRQEYAILAQTITHINEVLAENTVVNMWGEYILEHLEYDDLAKISEIKENGKIENELSLICKNCGEEFNIEIDTDSFFLSGLQKRKI